MKGRLDTELEQHRKVERKGESEGEGGIEKEKSKERREREEIKRTEL